MLDASCARRELGFDYRQDNPHDDDKHGEGDKDVHQYRLLSYGAHRSFDGHDDPKTPVQVINANKPPPRVKIICIDFITFPIRTLVYELYLSGVVERIWYKAFALALGNKINFSLSA